MLTKPQVYLMDLGSAAETYVDKEKIEAAPAKRRLKLGQEVSSPLPLALELLARSGVIGLGPAFRGVHEEITACFVRHGLCRTRRHGTLY